MTTLVIKRNSSCAKRFISFIAATVLLLATATTARAAQFGDFYYEVVNKTEVTITGYAGSGGVLTIPSAINGLPVTRIGHSAFSYNHTDLTGTLVIPDSVVGIDAYAFTQCTGLTGLTLGTELRDIGKSAFSSCHALSNELHIPEGVTNIGRNAFAGCYSLPGCVAIPDAVPSIGQLTFYLCTNLEYVVVGSGVTNIGDSAFEGCGKLMDIFFKSGPPTLGALAFYGVNTAMRYVRGQSGWDSTFGGNGTSVWTVKVSFDPGIGLASPYLGRYYDVGLPYGEFPTATPPLLTYAFAGWRTNESDTASVVTTNTVVPYAIDYYTLYATWAKRSQTVTFDTQGGNAVSPASKTVTFNGTYGTLPSPARTGYFFRGWRFNADGSGDEVESSTVVTALADHTLYANWKANTYTVTFDPRGGGDINPSEKSVTYQQACGPLPIPCRLGYAFADGWKDGFNGAGTQMTENSLVSYTSNFKLYANWTYDPTAAQTSAVGVALSLALPDTFSSASKITAKKLPSGLKYDATTKTVSGIPTKTGTFSVTISAEGVTPLAFAWTIEALPAWACGSFSGFHYDKGTVSMTVTAQGKTTGKLSANGTNYAFKASSFVAGGNPATGFLVLTEATAGKTALATVFQVTPASESATEKLGVVSGSFELGSDNYTCELFRNIWAEAPDTLAPYIGYYTATLAGCDTYGSGYLTLTIDKAGKAKVAGKLADGTAVSLSGVLALTEENRPIIPVYTAPASYQGGYFYVVAEIVKPASSNAYLRDREHTSAYWKNRNPQATGAYSGFDRTMVLDGGWYSKTDNLRDYYENLDLSTGTSGSTATPKLTVGSTVYPATYWDLSGVTITVVTNKTGVMTGLSAPAAGTPTDADNNDVWDYGDENVIALKIALTRATGLFKGSFKVWFDYGTTHTSKTLSYAGVLTPERENTSDGLEGRGYFLWPDKAEKSFSGTYYTFNWSYDFLLKDE